MTLGEARAPALTFLWALWCISRLSAAEDFTLVVVHTNDVHSHFEESNPSGGRCYPEYKENCVGGIARIMTEVKRIQSEEQHVVFLNAGDNYQGTYWYTVYKHKIVTEVIKHMRYDALCLGNHEFDDGPAGLAPMLLELQGKIPIVCCNLDLSGSVEMKDVRLGGSVVLQRGGRYIGVIGAVTPKSASVSKPGTIRILDDLSNIQKEARRLKQAGVDIIIALTHCGYSQEIKIANETPEIDLVVGGHTHTFLYTGDDYPPENKPAGPYPTIVNRTDGSTALVVQAYWFGKFLGHIKVTFDSEGKIKAWKGKPIHMDHSIKEDPATLAFLKEYEGPVFNVTKVPVGGTLVYLDAADNVCRVEECNFGNCVTDSFLFYYAYYHGRKRDKTKHWSSVNSAIVNGGSIRNSIDQTENMLREDLMTAFPFTNSLYVLTLSGETLYKIFEHSVAEYDYFSRTAQFMQVAGVRISYDMSLPPHERVTSLMVLCRRCIVPRYVKVSPHRQYRIVTTQYVWKQIRLWLPNENITDHTEGEKDLDVFEYYVGKMSPLSCAIENRISFAEKHTKYNDEI